MVAHALRFIFFALERFRSCPLRTAPGGRSDAPERSGLGAVRSDAAPRAERSDRSLARSDTIPNIK